ncbi:CDP-glucose 4,6-dehydratase [Geomonas subterranea]|uniref:CDP-glucose 4,6-dehydratase n=1 Tax=Geomonas subterranea TaxID=2847989 RepID=A0ABX8LQZ1_9BACT|nr:CDP-glucose 4,6-dehydratase [Geomonas subterranea]QXM11592.1 CDP-glucose 4,6-dehydratase [Geomonas subterranea]
MEDLGINSVFWRGRRVLVTGHTGFKGAWLSLWLNRLGAHVTGFALAPNTTPSLYELARVDELVDSHIGDVRDLEGLSRVVKTSEPEVVIHMAAQPLVRDSYRIPVDTYATNVMGTVHLLESVRRIGSVRAVVNVTTDKCYENREWNWGYRENEAMGGFDPYSSSKACSELVTAAYRQSFFNPYSYPEHKVAIATARAGNVIGGGDWAADRLVPDCMRSLLAGEPVPIRNPNAIRPWQHVLEPVSGYLALAHRLYLEGAGYAEGWNFGPFEEDTRPVGWIVERICSEWGEGAGFVVDDGPHPHEAHYLKLDSSKARNRLKWRPRLNLGQALDWSIQWYRAFAAGEDMRRVTEQQILTYQRQAQ